MRRKKGCDSLLLPSRQTHPEAQTVDLAAYGIPFVLQMGKCRVHTTRSAARGAHGHDCFQVTICTHGNITFKGAHGESWPLLPGRVLVLPPNTVHRLVSNTRGNVRYWLFLQWRRTGRNHPAGDGGGSHGRMGGRPPAGAAWLFERFKRLGAHLCRIHEQEARLPERIFRLLENERCTGAERVFRLRALMMRLLLAIVDAQPCGEVQDDVVKPITARMACAPEKPYSMDDLVSETKLSPTTILHLFRLETGKTPHQYLMACRLRRAEELLRSPEKKITDIALSLGFASSQHFAACFRRETGRTPRQWRVIERMKNGK